MAKKAGHVLHVLHILDRFHIMSHMSKAIDEVRAQEAGHLKARGYAPVLKHTRWLLLTRPENLTEKQEPRLAELRRYNLRSGPELPSARRLPVLLDRRVPHLG